ncbi:hypothetical protein AAIR98_000949 [Elusimicrobium simillimum]|uniref:LTA synthase family protein n=1 Tax=Elusimicrobium simillimum TaxID=3143438 RepID=UPI003C6FDB52
MKIVRLILEDFYHSLKSDFKLLFVLSIPGVVLILYGLYQLESFTAGAVIIGGLQKFAVEFLFLAFFLYLLHFFGLRNKWAYSLLFLCYIVVLSADVTLLMYFKERFGVKYMQTLEGGEYNFMSDWRVMTYLFFIAAYSIVPIQRWMKNISKPQALDKLVKTAILIPFTFIPFYNILPASQAFFVKHMLPVSPVYIIKGALAPQQTMLTALTPQTELLAEKYSLFTDTAATHNTPKFDRVILLTTEAMSNKFIRAFNPNLPEDASPTLDALAAKYPHTMLRPGALSTLYGLTAIFTGHPNAKLSYENNYPLSFVKQLKDNGYATAFIRGADEEYMDEHVHFQKAGFEQIYGARYFAKLPQYKDSVAWWGLTDRKLFDFAIDYLKENKNKKLFLNILTVDTHVPTGREKYLGQTYPPAPKQAYYNERNMARAFWMYDYDLGLFIERLEKENILDDKTLLIITGDHPFYNTISFSKLVKPYKEEFDFLPVIFVSKSLITTPLTQNSYASQTDLGPTILELTGFNKPRGMFGKSLFDNADRTLFDVKEDYIVIKDANGTVITPMQTAKKNDITALVNTFLK